MTNYIERYWRDATPEDAIKEPPMVARFRIDEIDKWSVDTLFGVDRSIAFKWRGKNYAGKECQVYDAPDPGEGWRLVDVDSETPQHGDEWLDDNGAWKKRSCGGVISFCNLDIYRRRITPTVTYVPFTWEDREQLRGRWVRAIDVMDNEWMITDLYIGSSGELRANSVSADELLSGFILVDTGEPVGKKVVE